MQLSDDLLETVKQEMPVLPGEWRERLAVLGIDRPSLETLLEAELDEAEVSYLELLVESMEDESDEFAKNLANWFVNLEIPLRRDEAVKLSDVHTNQGRLALYRGIHALIGANKLSSTNAKALLTKFLTGDEHVADIEAYARQHNLVQESDEGEIAKVVARVIEENPKAAKDVKNGEMKAIGFLVGQVMKHSQGRANPSLAQALIKKQLDA